MKRLLWVLLTSLAFAQGGNQGVANQFLVVTVAQLPAAAGYNKGWVRVVSDGNSTSDCTTGTGSNFVECISNGTAWAARGGGGGSVAFSSITGATNTTAAMVVSTGASIALSGTGTNQSNRQPTGASCSAPGMGVTGHTSTGFWYDTATDTFHICTVTTDELKFDSSAGATFSLPVALNEPTVTTDIPFLNIIGGVNTAAFNSTGLIQMNINPFTTKDGSGNFINLMNNSVSEFAVDQAGRTTATRFIATSTSTSFIVSDGNLVIDDSNGGFNMTSGPSAGTSFFNFYSRDAAHPLTISFGNQSEGGGTNTPSPEAPTFRAGIGSGNSIPVDWTWQCPTYTTVSGTSNQSQINCFVPRHVVAGLTNAAFSDIIDFSVASGSVNGGLVNWCVPATDGTDYQMTCGETSVSCVNKAGTIATNSSVIGTASSAASSGTQSITFNVTTASGKCTLQIKSTSTVVTPNSIQAIFAVNSLNITNSFTAK